ncbi:MAG TPA: FGGY family carbohydrate kinase, partial [Gammaproteobacteria bacterium]|nr:FGGY family carbohydrate kinase [Gammaproteobacteria bacterium]
MTHNRARSYTSLVDEGWWLCIDQGGQSTRAAVLDDAGRLLALGRAPVETARPGPYLVEHSPPALLASVEAAITAALEAFPDAARSLRGAALATQRSTLVCAQRTSGAALSAVLSWQDRRGARELEAAAGPRAKRIHELTGLRLSPHYGVGKLRWCLEHEPAVRAAAGRNDLAAAPLAAFLLHGLGVGEAWQVDSVNASRLLLMDLQSLAWSAELLEIFGAAREWLPTIRPCRFSYGTLLAGAAR